MHTCPIKRVLIEHTPTGIFTQEQLNRFSWAGILVKHASNEQQTTRNFGVGDLIPNDILLK